MPDRYLGQQIGKYRVIRLLGVGAFAWVYEAIDRDLEIPVALKILRPEFAGDVVAETRFRREASTAAKLRHPNIVVVRDVGQIDGASFVAMDLLSASLGQRLHRPRILPEAEVIRIGLDVAAALGAAHTAGVIHRDIKPDNILFGRADEAIVADFGLARALASDLALSKSNQVMGTPHYFSPEQARGLELDGRSDLYSLGVTLYRAVTGQLPFDGDDWYTVGRQHIDDPVTPPRTIISTISPSFDAILLQLMAKQPVDRFASAEALAVALQSLATPRPDREAMQITPTSVTEGPFNPMPATVVDVRTPLQPLSAASMGRRSSLVNTVGITAALLLGSAAILRSTNAGNLWSNTFGDRAATDSAAAVASRAAADSAARARTEVLASDSARSEIRRDSLVGVGRDSNATRSGSEGAPLPPAGTPTTSTGSTKPTVVRTRISVKTADDAVLFVDGKRVGVATWSGERAGARDVHLRAVIDNAPPGCPTAQRDTTLRINVAPKANVSLPVRSCAPIKLLVKPNDAHLVFTPLDGGEPLAFRADSVDGKLLVFGRYKVEVSLPRCTTYSDTVTAPPAKSKGTDSVFVRAPLFCG